MNQSQLEANTPDRCRARENACKHVTVGFGFTYDWLKNQSHSVSTPNPPTENCSIIIQFRDLSDNERFAIIKLKTALLSYSLEILPDNESFTIIKLKTALLSHNLEILSDIMSFMNENVDFLDFSRVTFKLLFQICFITCILSRV